MFTLCMKVQDTRSDAWKGGAQEGVGRTDDRDIPFEEVGFVH
jgi:hypothetical protein